jgi:hypothetical protein
MNSLLEFAKTPEGQGLLSAAFGGMAGARRGQPWNSIGRGGLAGLAGYTGAQDRITQQAESEAQRKYRDMQMQTLESQMARQKGQEQWRTGLLGVMEQAKPQTYDMVDTLGDGSGVGKASTAGNPQLLNDYLMLPNSPFADKLMEQRLFPKPQEPFTLGENQVRYGADGKIVAQGPAKPAEAEDDAKIKQFKYARANGYKGSFEQFVVLGPALMAAAAAPLRDAQVSNINAENAYNLPPPVAPRPPSGGGASVTAGGKTYTFPNAAAAAAFKKQAGLQ